MINAATAAVACTPMVLRLTLDLDRHPALRAPLEASLGDALALSNQLSGTDPLIIWQGPQDWLILCDAADPQALQERLTSAVRDQPVLITSAGDGLAAFTFAGPDAPMLLSGGTNLDLHADAFPIGASAITRFAQVHATLYRQVGRYTLIVDRQYANHIELWLTRLTA